MSENISNQPEMSKFITPTGKKEDIYFERVNDGRLYECHNGNRNEVVNKDNNLVVEGQKKDDIYTVLLEEATYEGSMWIIPLKKNGNTKYKYKYK